MRQAVPGKTLEIAKAAVVHSVNRRGGLMQNADCDDRDALTASRRYVFSADDDLRLFLTVRADHLEEKRGVLWRETDAAM